MSTECTMRSLDEAIFLFRSSSTSTSELASSSLSSTSSTTALLGFASAMTAASLASASRATLGAASQRNGNKVMGEPEELERTFSAATGRAACAAPVVEPSFRRRRSMRGNSFQRLCRPWKSFNQRSAASCPSTCARALHACTT